MKQHTSKHKCLDPWRPKKLQRLSALHLMEHLDNQLLVGTHWQGLSSLVLDQSQPHWADEQWRTWPRLSISVDQASDNICAVHAMKYLKQMNIGEWWCFSHGVHNDLKCRDQSCSVYPLLLVCLVVLNLPHGPEREEDMRYEQLAGCMQWYLQEFSPQTSTLFQARVANMHEELAAAGLLETSSGAHPDELVWEFLQRRWAAPKKGYRIKTCEFMRIHRSLKELVDLWNCLLFEREVLGLEMDFFTGKDFKKGIGLDEGTVRETGQVASTSGSALVDAKLLRSCGRNGVAVSAVVLSSPVNRRIVSIMYSAGAPMCAWESAESKACRASDTAHKWWMSQAQGDFASGLIDVFRTMGDLSVQRCCGFLDFEGLPREDVLAMRSSEDELADLHGRLCMSLICNRWRRCFQKIMGWPGKCFRMCLGAAQMEATIAEFKRDRVAFDSLASVPQRPKELDNMLARSPFHTTSVKQWHAAFRSSQWQPHPDFVALAFEHTNCFMHSELPKNIFNVAKNARQLKGSKRFRRAERAMAMALSRGTLYKSFRMKPIHPAIAVKKKSVFLKHMAFGKVKRRPTIDTSRIASTGKAPFFSPGAENTGLPVADLAVLSDMAACGTADRAKFATLGAVGSWRHKIIMRRQGSSSATNFDWHMPLCHFKGSAVVCMRVTLNQVLGYPNSRYIELAPGFPDPGVFSILDWGCITAMAFEWRSWCSFVLDFPNAKPHLCPATRVWSRWTRRRSVR